jgi:hypothetical protein
MLVHCQHTVRDRGGGPASSILPDEWDCNLRSFMTALEELIRGCV